MSLRFVLGRPGTGKTSLCLREITERLNEPQSIYYLVPEQFSLQSEKILTRRAPGTEVPGVSAFLRAQVLSFNRLAYRLFARTGGPPGKQVDDLGRSMLLRKILYDNSAALIFYARSADKQGFVEDLARTITELNHYGITVSDLEARAETAEPGLKAKLTDLALILQKYKETVQGRYLLTDETLTLLARQLEKPEAAEVFKGSLFWVDGFSGFTPQERQVLGPILRAAERVTVALTLHPRGAGHQPDTLYETTRDTQRILTELAHTFDVPVEPVVRLETDYRHADAPELRFFTEAFSVNGSTKKWPHPSQGSHSPRAVEVVSCADRYAEVHEAARWILTLIGARGYRYRDIAVLCGDRAGYEKILRNVFDRLRIPLFIDTKTDILPHPLTELIRAAAEVAAFNWRYESVFRFLKTRLTDLTADEIDRLENYVLAQGVKGYYWRYPFTRDESKTKADAEITIEVETKAKPDTEQAEAARLKTLQALSPFTDGLLPDKKEPVRAFCLRVFNLLYALDIPAKLTALYAERTAAGDHETARTHRQIWPKICELFDKLAEMLGDELITLKEFVKLLDAGLAQADLGLIPPSVDQVLLGDAGRSRFPEIKALLVLGANDGKLPPPAETAGLFTESERAFLCDTRLELAPDRARRAGDDWFALYCALCQPREQLVFLFSAGEPGGKPLRPAKIISRLTELFPSLSISRAPVFSEYPVPEGGFSSAPARKLLPETAARLYGPTVVTSASQIEQFAECPFAYFVTHTLRARERKIYQVQSADLGVLFHETLALFSRQLAEEGLAWGVLDQEEITRRVNTYVDILAPDDAHVLRSSARNRHILQKVKHICVSSVWALSEQVRRGSFIPTGFELDFKPDSPVTTLEVRLNNKRRLVLTGRIDRVDILRMDNGVCYVKIIDYKSGTKKFDLDEALRGTQLQLILYMNALLKNGRALFGEDHVNWEARPGGVFYFHIDDPILAYDGEPDAAELETLLLRCFRLSGLVLAETDAVTGMDGQLENGGDSLIIPVKVNKNGAYGKMSSVAELEEFEQIGRAVEDKVKEIGIKITEGVILPDPYRNKYHSACDYCRYGAICGYSVSQ